MARSGFIRRTFPDTVMPRKRTRIGSATTWSRSRTSDNSTIPPSCRPAPGITNGDGDLVSRSITVDSCESPVVDVHLVIADVS